MNNRIVLVDRRDQAEWYFDDSWPVFCVNMKDKKSAIMTWLDASTTGRVVVSGDGVLPEENKPYKIWETYDKIQNNIYKLYFEDGGSAALFKLAWGGSL